MTRILNITVLLWAIQYLVRRIPAEEYSLLVVLTPLLLLVPPLQTLLAGGLSRYVTAAYALGDDRRITQLTSTMFPICLAAGVVFAAAGLTAAVYIDRIMSLPGALVPDARLMVALLMLSAAVTFPAAPFTVGLFVRQKFVLTNVLNTGGVLLQIGLLVTLLLGIGPQVKWVVLAQVTGNLANLIVRVVISMSILPSLRFAPRMINWKESIDVLRFNGWYSLFSVTSIVRDAADPWILYAFANPVAVSAFHLGAIVDRNIRRIVSLASDPMNPALTAMHALEQRERLQNVFLRGGRIALWIVMAPAVMLSVFRSEVYSLYVGPKFELYHECATVMLLLFAVYPTHYAVWMLHKVALAMTNIRPVAIATFSMQMVNLITTFVLVGMLGMGATGSALATFAVCTTFNLAVFFPLCLSQLELPARRFFKETILPGLLPSLFAGAVCVLLRLTMEPSSLVAVAGAMAIGGAVYVVVLMVYCMAPSDRRDVQRVFAALRKPLTAASDG